MKPYRCRQARQTDHEAGVIDVEVPLIVRLFELMVRLCIGVSPHGVERQRLDCSRSATPATNRDVSSTV